MSDDLDAWIDGVDAALTAHFGTNHQEQFANAGRVIASFDWAGVPDGITREGWGGLG